MNSTDKATAGQLPATLEAKINAYQEKSLERLREACTRYGISGKTSEAIAADLAAFLHYKTQPLRIDAKGFKEIARNTGFIQALQTADDLPLAMVLQSYADIDAATDIIGILRQTAEPNKERELGAEYGKAFMASTPIAQAQLLRQNIFAEIDKGIQDYVGGQLLFLFYLTSIYFSGATAEELQQVEPRGLKLTEKERELSVKRALRTAAEFESQRTYAPTDTSGAEEISGIEIPEEGGTAGKPTKDGEADGDTQPVQAAYIDEQRKRQQYYTLRQSYTKMLSRPLPVSCAVQPQQSLGAVLIKDLMQVSDLFKAQAAKFNISETRLYQCLDAVQRIAQADGVCRFNAALGYNYFDYETTLAGFVKQAVGSDIESGASVSGSLTAEFWVALYVLSNIYISIDEEVIIGYIKDKDNPEKKKPITQTRTAWIKVLNVPMITAPTKPKESSAYNIKLVIEVHNFVKEGRTKEFVMDGKLRRAIKQPIVHIITKEEEQTARKLFKGSASGIRFYNTLLSCQHKKEEDLLAQVFGYQQRKSNTQTEEEFYKVSANIKKHKTRDEKRLAEMFKAAKEKGILESAERYATKDSYRPFDKKPIYIWQWKRRNPTEGEGVEE